MDAIFKLPRWVVFPALIALTWFLVLSPALVFAQDAGGVVVTVPPTEVVFNWGDWVAILLANLADPQSVAWTVFAGALAWFVARLSPPLQWAFKLFQVEQLLKNSILAAINATKGATEGQQLTVNVGSEVLAKAVQYAVDNGAAWLIDWMGGRKGVESKIIARLPLAPSVSGAELKEAAKDKPATLTK